MNLPLITVIFRILIRYSKKVLEVQSPSAFRTILVHQRDKIANCERQQSKKQFSAVGRSKGDLPVSKVYSPAREKLTAGDSVQCVVKY